MSITAEKNLALLTSVVPEEGEMAGLPHTIYREFEQNAALRLLHTERLTKFVGLLAGQDETGNQVTAFNQMRHALGMADVHTMGRSFKVMLDVMEQTDGMSDDEKKQFFEQKRDELEKGYYIDRKSVKHTVNLGTKSNAGYLAAGLLASSIALFSGISGFAVAFYNAALSGWAAKGHGENLWSKLKQRPHIEKHYPTLFNMLLMESYVEHRMKHAMHPLEVERDALLDETTQALRNGEWSAEHTDQLATVAAVDLLGNLINYAPAKAVRLLQMEGVEPDPAWNDPLSPLNAFRAYSKHGDIINDPLGIEWALRDRFPFKDVSAAALNRVENHLMRAGVDVKAAIKPSNDVDATDRYSNISAPIQQAADRIASSFLNGKEVSDLPIVSKVLMPDMDGISEAEQASKMQKRLSGAIQRLAVSIQRERWTEEEKGTNTSRVLRRRQERRAARQEGSPAFA